MEVEVTGFVRQTLDQLFAGIPIKVLHPQEIPAVPAAHIVFDSRQVQPGSVFVALRGGTTDGHRYIPVAIERGASGVVGEEALEGLAVPYIQVADSRAALAHLSAALYGFPARQMVMIGVTGTDGKTTTANMLFQILLSAGIRAGIISTVNAVIGDEVLDTGFHVTTPEAPDVQRYLARMATAGLTHVVLEATSHGLAQHRVTGCEFDLALVTNITHEHLDYHGTYEAYREAKGRLFRMLGETRPKPQVKERLAVLNRDDSSFEFLQTITPARQVTYSRKAGEVDLWAEDERHLPSGLRFTARGKGIQLPIECGLLGDYNVSNCLAAISAAVFGLGIAPEAAQRGIASLPGVPGRMEKIDMGQNFLAMVDFAHTPNALKVALQAARRMTQGKVIAVFGSAGLRDREKRRMMPEVSAELADISILTAEDPRVESLEEILQVMAEAAVSKGGDEGKTFFRVPDRGDAIRTGVKLAQPGDVVITCGKGHEQSMCFGTVEHAWDDRIAMRAALAELLGVPGPQMPILPTSK
jgi:UDP-N-acetylmuramoyl-L-alanyl-D-glutamate--2,6-diaminopimelate ligase